MSPVRHELPGTLGEALKKKRVQADYKLKPYEFNARDAVEAASELIDKIAAQVLQPRGTPKR
jgi:hypothetical protein